MKDHCPICGSKNTVEVLEDSIGRTVIVKNAKYTLCKDCTCDYVTGSQLDHNSKCEVIEIAGPHKPIEIGSIHRGNIYFDWSWIGKGFGQLSVTAKDGKLFCNNECMSRDSVRELLHALADHIADTAILDDEPNT